MRLLFTISDLLWMTVVVAVLCGTGIGFIFASVVLDVVIKVSTSFGLLILLCDIVLKSVLDKITRH